MYEQHFGLAQAFSGDGFLRSDTVFRTSQVDTLVGELAVALSRRDSVAILCGTAGTGKSTVAQTALRELGTCLALAVLSQQPKSPEELLEQILTDFGCEVFGMSDVERRQVWRQFALEAAATDTRVCLLVEDADSLDIDVLRALHRLTASDSLMLPGCNVILTTNADPSPLLCQPELLALNQRVRLRRDIAPLGTDEIRDYLDFRCELAGVVRDSLFGDDVPAELHERTGGIIRVIDNLLETALACAAANHEPRVTAATISRVADTQLGLRRLEASQVDALLEAPGPVSELPRFRAKDIPTLTEYVPGALAHLPLQSGQA